MEVPHRYQKQDYRDHRIDYADREHDDDADRSPEQGNPHVVVGECGSPSRSSGERGIETSIVNQGVRNHEQVRHDKVEGIEIPSETQSHGQYREEHVRSARFLVRTVLFFEILHVGEESVFADSLEDDRALVKVGHCGADGHSQHAEDDQRPPGGF